MLTKTRSPKTRSLVAVDISTSAVKLLELSGSLENPRVESIAVIPLQPGSIQDKQIKNVDNVAEAIRLAFEKAKIKPVNVGVVTALPSSAAFTKILPVPAGLTELEMEEQINHEAANHIPFALDEVRLDFQPIGPSALEDMVDVMLVAVRDDQAQNRLDPMIAENLNIEVLDVESLAIQNAFRYWAKRHNIGETQAVAMVDIGSEVLTLTVFQKGSAIYTREQSYGMQDLVREIMSRFGVSFSEADRMLRTGDLPASYKEEVLPATRDALSQQINRLMQFFYATVGTQDIDRILLAGGGARLEGLASAASDLLGIPTQTFDPFENLSRNNSVSLMDLETSGSSFMTAFGLALRQFTPDHR